VENGFMVEDQVGDLKLQWQGNKFLTSAFIWHGIKGRALLHMNMCQKFLRMDSLSNIMTADRRYITWVVQNSQCDETLPKYHQWPKQGDPGE
jgi:hypothetical protein